MSTTVVNGAFIIDHGLWHSDTKFTMALLLPQDTSLVLESANIANYLTRILGISLPKESNRFFSQVVDPLITKARTTTISLVPEDSGSMYLAQRTETC